MKYIKKLIEDRYGHSNECWRVTNINISLVPVFEENEEGQPIQTGERFQAIIELKGWKDITACQNKKETIDKKIIVIENAEDMSSFDAVYQDIANSVLNDPQFSGGEIIEVTE